MLPIVTPASGAASIFGLLAIVEDELVRPRSWETYLLELDAHSVLSVSLESDHPVGICLVGEEEWTAWHARRRDRHQKFSGVCVMRLGPERRADFEITMRPTTAVYALMVSNDGDCAAAIHIDIRSARSLIDRYAGR